MKAWIGIDVSKDTLDACLLKEAGKDLHKQFRNDASGIQKLLRWVRSQVDGACHYCMESTGAYGMALAETLAEAEETVSVENPARIKHFGLCQGVINKTDKVDAKVIASYCRTMAPSPWRRSRPEVRALTALVRRLESLQDLLTAEKNRLAQPGLLPEVKRSLKHTIRFLEAEMDRLENQINTHLDKHPDLKADQELLISIKGIGEKTALSILAELPDVNQFEAAQSAAAFAGLNPKEERSGTSVRRKTRLSKAGNARLRKALYFPALSAARWNPLVKELYDRLIAKGKTHMCALGAAMRKLLMIAYGVLKSRRTFTIEAAKATP